jgi:acyl-CoA thioesterase FadM
VKWRPTATRCRSSKPTANIGSRQYDDDLEIVTTGAIVSLVRVKFEYQVVRAHDGATLANGHTVHASLDTTGKAAATA